MTSNLRIPSISRVNKVASTFRDIVGERITKTVKFMGKDLKISKLSVGEVEEVQKKVEEFKKSDAPDEGGMELLKLVIRLSVEGGADITDDDFNVCPMDDMSKLSDDILAYSGMKSGK